MNLLFGLAAAKRGAADLGQHRGGGRPSRKLFGNRIAFAIGLKCEGDGWMSAVKLRLK